MEAIPVLVGLLPLALLTLIGWLLYQAGATRPAQPGADPATTVRRVFVYGLLYVAVLVAGQGLTELASEILASDAERSNTTLARALAFLVVGGPAGIVLVRAVDRRLVERSEERTSIAWTLYLVAALATTLIGTMIEGHDALAQVIDLAGDGDRAADRSSRWAPLIGTAIWGGLWAGHWFGLRRRHPPPTDLDLATGTVIGLVPMAVGAAGSLWVVFDEGYRQFLELGTERGGPSFGSWFATAVVGAAAWVWYWPFRYRRAARTQLWLVVVVPVGLLAGFVATVTSVALAANTGLVWFLGEPAVDDAAEHFDDLPAIAAVLVVGMVGWLSHRSVLAAEVRAETVGRTEVIRAHDYLLAMAALVTAVVGAVMVIASLLADGSQPRANSIIAGATMLGVAGPVWMWFWSSIRRHATSDPPAEQASTVRRIYLYSLFGVGGAAAFVGLLAALTTVFEDALDGLLSRDTLHDARIGIAVVVAVTGVAWYHYAVFRAEREGEEPHPVPPGPAPPPPAPPTELDQHEAGQEPEDEPAPPAEAASGTGSVPTDEAEPDRLAL